VSPDRGLLDTSVVIGREEIDVQRLPRESAISTLTLAELTCGPLATDDSGERARRQELLQRIEANLEALPFDPRCARAMASVGAAVGRKIGGARKIDLMIAATALAYGLPLYTLNASDLKGLEGLVEVVDLGY